MNNQLIDMTNLNEYFPKINLSSGILRIALLNECNYKCPHCFKEGEQHLYSHINNNQFLLRVIKYGFENFGIKKIKLTGGEPLLYKNLDKLLKGIRDIGISDIDITTNGYYIKDTYKILIDNGVKEVTITINTLDKEIYKLLHHCNNGALERVLEGIELLKNKNIKISTNIVPLDIEGQNVLEVVKFSWDNNMIPRICQPMYIPGVESTNQKKAFEEIYNYLKERAIKQIISKCYSVTQLYFDNSKKVVMLHNLCDNNLCDICGKYMYIRLTSDGKLKPCLCSNDTEIEIPPNPSSYELEKCFTIAINNMGKAINKGKSTYSASGLNLVENKK